MDVNIQQLKQTSLSTVPPDQAFWVCRGDRVRNLKDLANCIESLNPAQFKYHVDEVHQTTHFQTTHFSQWINDVLHNPLLAKDVNLPVNMRDQMHLVKTIRDHVHWLEHA
jgi:hypothetical protein